MKLTILTLITILLLCLYSCGDRPYPRTMQIADSLVDYNPDSTLTLLQQIKDSIAHEPEETQIYYKLLSIKAEDKAYITHTSDSLIMQVVHYYKHEKDTKHLHEAYFYAGCVYRDLGDAPQALEYFQKAIDMSNKSTDYNLIGMMHDQIGMIYLYQEVYDKAPEMFKKAYHYSTLVKDSIGMTYYLRDLGRSFSTLNQADSSIYYYKEAIKLAKAIKSQELESTICCEFSGLYTKLNRDKEAYETMQIGLRDEEIMNSPAQYTISARYYENIGQIDSAIYYYSLLLPIDSYRYKQEAYQGLGNAAQLKGEYEKALMYFNKYLDYTDSLQSINQTEAIRKISSLYNYQLRQKENKKLRIEANKERRWNLFLATTLIFSLTLFFAYWQYRKRKEQAKFIQEEKLKNIQKEQYHLSLAYIEQNKKQISKLETLLLEAENSKNKLHQSLLQSQKELIERINEQLEAQQRVNEQSEITLKQSDIYKAFHQAAESNTKLKETDWQELILAVNEVYNDFTQRLYLLYPIKDIELQVCLLLKINLSPTQVSVITTRSKQATTSIRKRLYYKVFNKEGTPEQWDAFIRNF